MSEVLIFLLLKYLVGLLVWLSLEENLGEAVREAEKGEITRETIKFGLFLLLFSEILIALVLGQCALHAEKIK